MNPESLKYAETHEWLALEGEIATIGITKYAVKELGDLVYLDLPDVGKDVKKGDTFGEIESVKAVSELCAPVDGVVVEVNKPIADDLETLTADPYGRGWMIKLKVSDTSQADSLLSASEYEKLVEKERSEKEE